MVWPKYANVHTLFDLWSLHFFPFLRRGPSVDLPQCQRMYIFWAQSRYQRQSQEVKSQKPSHSLPQADSALKKQALSQVLESFTVEGFRNQTLSTNLQDWMMSIPVGRDRLCLGICAALTPVSTGHILVIHRPCKYLFKIHFQNC